MLHNYFNVVFLTKERRFKFDTLVVVTGLTPDFTPLVYR